MKQQEEGESSNRGQQLRNNAPARRRRAWYGRALDCLHLWIQPHVVPPPPRAAVADRRPRCCWPWAPSSVKAAVARAAARFCCVPACSYETVLMGVHVDAVAPTPTTTRSSGHSVRSRSPTVAAPTPPPAREHWVALIRGRPTVAYHAARRRILMEELATGQRDQMEAMVVDRWLSRGMWTPPGASRLCLMSLPDAAADEE